MFRLTLLTVLFLGLAGSADAQHAIDVQRKVVSGDFFEALRTYRKMPRRRVTTDGRVAAAKAAWALGLPEVAIDTFEEALRDPKLTDIKRAQLYFSRGIIEYQERRYQIAVLYAEKAVRSLEEASPLRGRALVLWGQSLGQLESYGAAENKLLKALEEVSLAERPDVHFLLGETRVKLGKLEEAGSNLQQVPLEHARTADAMRMLALVALEKEDFDSVAFWLNRGRDEFPDRFLDSWVDYALLKVAIAKDDVEEVRSILADAGSKYPPADHWLTLLEATAEGYIWKTSGRAQWRNR